MRILRSQYVNLQNNVNARTTTRQVEEYKPQLVASRPTSYNITYASDSRQRNSGYRSSPYTTTRDGIGHNANGRNTVKCVSPRSSKTAFNNGVGLRTVNCATTAVGGLQERQTLISARSLSTSSESTRTSGYETLNQTDRKTLNKNRTAMLVTNEQHGAVDLTSSQQNGDLSNGIIEKTTTTCEEYHHLRIKFSNVADTVGNINVSVQFTDMSPRWLSSIYRTYEGDLWDKVARIPPTRTCKWLFHCTFCHKQLCQFATLINHLNRHLELFPYVCKFCARPYVGRQPLIKHLRFIHGVESEYSNYMCV